ncbi:MAG: pyrimidine dimer DNA glycosylase/endonuclease V [Candidatus Pacearchaeota archaeon]
MTRMWNLPPKKMCTQHLLGEHKELHQAVGTINAGKNLGKHIEMGQIEVHNIRKRHDEIMKEMLKRGFNHKSPLPKFKSFRAGYIDKEFNKKDLISRCKNCREMFKNEF